MFVYFDLPFNYCSELEVGNRSYEVELQEMLKITEL